MDLHGIHHVTAVSGRIGENAYFYTNVLGLRLVKRSVNQDDTSAYHLFYADRVGSPGTDMTFFDWPHVARDRRGTDSIVSTAFRVNGRDALDYWQERFEDIGVEHKGIEHFAGRDMLRFYDPEGQRLMLVDDEGAPYEGEFWEDGREVVVYEMDDGGPGREVWVVEEPEVNMARMGAGGVHHVAFRVSDSEEQQHWHERITSAGLPISGFIDRYYFKSIYFRISNGILFEIATDGPGFATDEDVESLGERLALPPFLEPHREQIEAGLKPIEVAPAG